MAMIELPGTPGPAASALRLIEFGGVQAGLLGGAAQRINRMGARWECAVTMPPMHPDMARRWAAALVLGVQFGALWSLRQPGLVRGAIGAPLVAGGGQAGMALAVDGMAPSAVWSAGQFVSVTAGGVSALYQLAAAGEANGAGVGALALTTPLRRAPDDNAPVRFAPVIAGALDAGDTALAFDRARLGRLSFTITEMD